MARPPPQSVYGQTLYVKLTGWGSSTGTAPNPLTRNATITTSHSAVVNSVNTPVASGVAALVQKYCQGIAYRFAKGNIISDGHGGITIGEPHDQGLVFKWGSLVGISLPDRGATGSSPFVAADIAFTPARFTGTITDWASVPWCATDFAPYGNTAIDHLVQVHNPANGIGDICRYMGVIDSANWRMPTASEIAELYGSPNQDGADAKILGPEEWVDGNYYQLRGRAMGPNQNSVAINGNDTDARVTNADPYINGSVFLPASGRRDSGSGVIAWIGTYGWYWSSTALTNGDGYHLVFNSGGVGPQASHPRTYAFPIRCIRE